MQITTRFTIAIHTMLCIAYFSEKKKVTSDFIAESTNTNPVIIRRIMGQLKEANLVEVRAGVGGASISKGLEEISLYDIFMAVQAVEGSVFAFHNNPNCDCPIGKNIHGILDVHLKSIQVAMNEQMKKTTLEKLLEETSDELAKDGAYHEIDDKK